MAELHSITGLFYASFPGTSPWGGYFIKGIEGKDSEIEGMLADIYGISEISGAMDLKRLKFRKQYREENLEQAFDYKFSLKDGIWLGEFVSTSNKNYRERSICKTNLCIGNLAFRKVDMRTPEGFAKAAIESMVESGKIEKFKDPVTEEEMIRLLKK